MGSSLGTVLTCSRKARDPAEVVLCCYLYRYLDIFRYNIFLGGALQLRRAPRTRARAPAQPTVPQELPDGGGPQHEGRYLHYLQNIHNIYNHIYPQIWSEDITRPLAWVWSGEHRVTAASWSPARPSVVFAAREDGVLMVMDILYHQQPVVQVGISTYLIDY